MYISFYIVLSMPFYFCENMKVNSSKGFLALLSFRVYLFDDVDDVELEFFFCALPFGFLIVFEIDRVTTRATVFDLFVCVMH